ncbi:hypothetical protein HDV03_002336 [Kappamyces sp. JEL0829]|nr:hypothetical protein HDV03_002336 [Kappamyces sp. JEL0829]
MYSFAAAVFIGSVASQAISGLSQACSDALTNLKLEKSCGVSAASLSSAQGLSTFLGSAATTLPTVCGTDCQSGITAAAALFANGACQTDKISGISGSDFATYLSIGQAVVCTKDPASSQFCLVSQLPVLQPVLTQVLTGNNALGAVTPLLSNTTFVCSSCFKAELANVQALTLPASISSVVTSLANSIKQQCASVTTTTTTAAPSGPAYAGAESRGSLLAFVAVAVLASWL